MQFKTVNDLDLAIAELEQVKQRQQIQLRSDYNRTVESLNPISIIKHKLADITEKITGPGDTRNSLLTMAGSIGLSFLTKQLFVGKSNSTIKTMLGGLVESSSYAILLGHAEEIKAWAVAIYNNLLDDKKV